MNKDSNPDQQAPWHDRYKGANEARQEKEADDDQRECFHKDTVRNPDGIFHRTFGTRIVLYRLVVEAGGRHPR